MELDKFSYSLYLVVSENDCTHFSLLEVVEQAIRGGVDLVQLREKNIDFSDFLRKAKELKALCDRYKVPLVINDHVEIAIEIGAWGVHVGRSDMQPSEIAKLVNAPKHIGWSLEEISQLESQEIKFVDHLGVSPIYATPTKTNTVIEWGLEGLQTIRNMTELPLVGIGQMNENTISDVIKAGANCVAVVSAICGSTNPYEATRIIKQKINEAR